MAKKTNAQTAIEDIDETLSLIAYLEENYTRIWERGRIFLSDVREHLLEVRETIEERGIVTERQRSAIDNWNAGVCRWHPEMK